MPDRPGTRPGQAWPSVADTAEQRLRFEPMWQATSVVRLGQSMANLQPLD